MARPGGHVTGFSLIAPDLAAKHLELARETLPRLSRVAIIWNPHNASVALQFQQTQAAARVIGLTLESIPVRQSADFEPGLQATTRAGAQALITTEDALLVSQRAQSSVSPPDTACQPFPASGSSPKQAVFSAIVRASSTCGGALLATLIRY